MNKTAPHVQVLLRNSTKRMLLVQVDAVKGTITVGNEENRIVAQDIQLSEEPPSVVVELAPGNELGASGAGEVKVKVVGAT